jgi:hypothetical protein
MADFTIKQHDTRPAWTVQLKDDLDGTPSNINLTTAAGVRFLMRSQTAPGALKVNGTCAITNASTGTISYTFVAADTDTVGAFNVEVEITWSDGGVQTVPNTGYWTVQVVDDLDVP